MNELERMFKEAIQEIGDAKLRCANKSEVIEFANGVIGGLYIAIKDYETWEKLEKKIRDYLEENFDLFLGM